MPAVTEKTTRDIIAERLAETISCHIEDIGIGSYEFHGTSGNDVRLIAELDCDEAGIDVANLSVYEREETCDEPILGTAYCGRDDEYSVDWSARLESISYVGGKATGIYSVTER